MAKPLSWLESVRNPSSSGPQRVVPSESGKAREVPVGRTEQEAVLNGECGEVRVLDQIPPYRAVGQQARKDLDMPIARLRDRCTLAIHPRTDLLPGVGDGFRLLEDARVGDYAQERQQAWPGQTDRSASAELPIRPFARCAMLEKRCDVGVDQNIGVDQNHLKDSPSVAARTSETLSMLPSLHRPRLTVRVRNGSLRRGREAI